MTVLGHTQGRPSPLFVSIFPSTTKLHIYQALFCSASNSARVAGHSGAPMCSASQAILCRPAASSQPRQAANLAQRERRQQLCSPARCRPGGLSGWQAGRGGGGGEGREAALPCPQTALRRVPSPSSHLPCPPPRSSSLASPQATSPTRSLQGRRPTGSRSPQAGRPARGPHPAAPAAGLTACSWAHRHRRRRSPAHLGRPAP